MWTNIIKNIYCLNLRKTCESVQPHALDLKQYTIIHGLSNYCHQLVITSQEWCLLLWSYMLFFANICSPSKKYVRQLVVFKAVFLFIFFIYFQMLACISFSMKQMRCCWIPNICCNLDVVWFHLTFGKQKIIHQLLFLTVHRPLTSVWVSFSTPLHPLLTQYMTSAPGNTLTSDANKQTRPSPLYCHHKCRKVWHSLVDMIGYKHLLVFICGVERLSCPVGHFIRAMWSRVEQ